SDSRCDGVRKARCSNPPDGAGWAYAEVGKGMTNIRDHGILRDRGRRRLAQALQLARRCVHRPGTRYFAAMAHAQDHPLHITNTLTRKKEAFIPLDPPRVGLYVCGPTVYSDVHLGNVRSFLTFDILFRWLTFLGYNVRYVRNITDVGHLVDDIDEGEDKIAKRARMERLEPMEIVQKYTNGFREVM